MQQSFFCIRYSTKSVDKISKKAKTLLTDAPTKMTYKTQLKPIKNYQDLCIAVAQAFAVKTHYLNQDHTLTLIKNTVLIMYLKKYKLVNRYKDESSQH